MLSPRWKGLLPATLLFLTIFGCFFAIAASNLHRPETDAAAAGLTGHLNASATPLLAGRTEAALNSALTATARHDTTGVALLIAQGDLLAVDGGTTLLILDAGFAVSQVRLTDGPSAGEAVWVPSDWIAR